MRKKLIAFVMTILFTFSLASAAVTFAIPAGGWKANYTAQQLAQLKNRELKERLKIAGKTFDDEDLPPVIKGGRVLVPVRAITRGMRAQVDWNEATQTVTITKNDVTVTIVLGSSQIKVTDDEGTHYVQMDQLVQIISNRTFVPLRFLAEAFGDKIHYDDDTGDIDVQVRLDTPDMPTLSASIATWDAVDHENNGYRLRLFRNMAEVTRVTIAHGASLSYNFSPHMTTDGVYTVRVMALGTGDYIDSKESVHSLPQLVGVTTPAAPTNPVVNDAANTFGWTNVPGYNSTSLYEYSVNSGSTWHNCTANPQPVGNHAYAAGVVQVRVEADYPAGRAAGQVLASPSAFTLSGQTVLATPATPTLLSNIAAWTSVAHENDGYKLRLFRDGDVVTTVTIAHGAALTYDFSASMTTSGTYTVRVTALGTGDYTDSAESAPSAPQNVDD